MSKAVAQLMTDLPGSTFENTGGGCMVVAWPTGRQGAIVVTALFGAGAVGDTFSRGDDQISREDHRLTGFEAWYHHAWYSEDHDSANGQQIYVSEDFDATAHLDADGWWPEDEYAFEGAQNEAHAVAEVPRVAVAAHDFRRALKPGR